MWIEHNLDEFANNLKDEVKRMLEHVRVNAERNEKPRGHETSSERFIRQIKAMSSTVVGALEKHFSARWLIQQRMCWSVVYLHFQGNAFDRSEVCWISWSTQHAQSHKLALRHDFWIKLALKRILRKTSFIYKHTFLPEDRCFFNLEAKLLQPGKI